MDVTLYWLTQDLRLDDNPALISAARSNVLLCVYCVDSRWFHPHRYHVTSMGAHRWRFLQQAMDDLEAALAARNQRLMREYGVPEQVLARLIAKHGVTRLVCSRQVGSDELAVLAYLQRLFPALQIQQFDSNTLFARDQLPHSLECMRDGFAAFRQLATQQLPLAPIQAPDSLPPPVLQLVKSTGETDGLPPTPLAPPLFHGGERVALARLETWPASIRTHCQEPTENSMSTSQLCDHDASHTFSPWLSHGNLSARRLLGMAQRQSATVPPSIIDTLYASLLQREYRQWLALSMGNQLFHPRGLTGKPPLACGLHPERYQKWRHGTTPWPLVNACMRQLRETGYLSTLGRRIAAQCFVHELSIDWRYGAAWFEHTLIDYDVANNWTHWQDVAGIGANNVGQQPFDIDKLTDQYDATGEYRRRWAPDSDNLRAQPLDSVDAADWPIKR